MKAVQINAYGGSEVFEIHDIPNPVAGNGQILVEVYDVSINPFDAKLRSGAMQKMIPLQLPVTWGDNYAGIVTEVRAEVSEFKVGDEVYGSASILSGGSGAFAEFATANIANSSHKPTSASFEEAAALPLVGSSAVQALEDHIRLQNGQKILIHGGAGGIGHIAIQLAKSLGAYVATTVSSDDTEFAKNLGADEVIDYKNQHFEEILKDYDAVYDTVGGETTIKSFKVLKKGGVIVSMLGAPDQKLAEEQGVIAIGQATKTTDSHLKRLAELVDSGKIKVNIDKIFPLEQVKEAFDYQEKNSPRGKVVLKIK